MSRVKSFHVKILLLDKQELIQEIQDKTTGQDLLDNIFKYLNLIETAYFGLRYQDNDNQTVITFFLIRQKLLLEKSDMKKITQTEFSRQNTIHQFSSDSSH